MSGGAFYGSFQVTQFVLWEKDLKTIQGKFHEALRPLLFAWANLTEDGDEMLGQAIADSVKLWCQVNFNLTCLRRKNVLKATDAEYLDLLKSRFSFNIEEYDQLFGSTFRKTLVDLRKDEGLCSLMERAGAFLIIYSLTDSISLVAVKEILLALPRSAQSSFWATKLILNTGEWSVIDDVNCFL